MLYNNLLEAIGNTPLVKLNKMVSPDMADIYVKYEGLNVGGSIKTRTALAMIEQAEKNGLLTKDSIIVEPTSGNQGIGLSLIGALKGYKVKIIMPDSVSVERKKLCEHYGAEVILVHDNNDIGEAMDMCIKLSLKMKQENSNVCVPGQFQNIANVVIHRDVTAKEILNDCPTKIDGFCSGIGTGGTLSGIGETLKKANPECVVWALEPEKAAMLSNGKLESHLQMGIGDGIIPEILDKSIIDDIKVIKDDEAVFIAQMAARLEGFMCGITSGTNIIGAMMLARKLGKGHTVVTILPDTGERYFSTPLFSLD